jgi:hypothetical protein
LPPVLTTWKKLVFDFKWHISADGSASLKTKSNLSKIVPSSRGTASASHGYLPILESKKRAGPFEKFFYSERMNT